MQNMFSFAKFRSKICQVILPVRETCQKKSALRKKIGPLMKTKLLK